ncbi:hypothetical protein ACSCB1_24970 [Streptomyces europaeiscabiei]|uniref:hypothetical protein n=1 Tax=Streptomyces europaeiscabiei TaxID=146819 RepID=UPI00069B1EF8|nr:hypothetical protein [Streptomyces europaeiscabiei]MDX3843845.1 hypothetical protein [Streptomyces europaeiscabiei]
MERRRRGRGEREPAASPRLRASLPYVFFGLGTGVLVLYAALGDVSTDEQRGAVATPAAVALTQYGPRRMAAVPLPRRSTRRTALHQRTGRLPAGLLLLGALPWTGLLLLSFGAVPGVAAVCCAAALAQTLALVACPGDPQGIGLLVYGVAAALQACLVRGLLGRATAHR